MRQYSDRIMAWSQADRGGGVRKKSVDWNTPLRTDSFGWTIPSQITDDPKHGPDKVDRHIFLISATTHGENPGFRLFWPLRLPLRRAVTETLTSTSESCYRLGSRSSQWIRRSYRQCQWRIPTQGSRQRQCCKGGCSITWVMAAFVSDDDKGGHLAKILPHITSSLLKSPIRCGCVEIEQMEYNGSLFTLYGKTSCFFCFNFFFSCRPWRPGRLL